MNVRICEGAETRRTGCVAVRVRSGRETVTSDKQTIKMLRMRETAAEQKDVGAGGTRPFGPGRKVRRKRSDKGIS